MFCGTSLPSDKGYTVGVIGAGVAGLQQARALRAQGIACLVFDKAPRPGGLWRENYASYRVQVPTQLYEFPDFPIRRQSVCADVCAQEYMDGADVQAYIESYVKEFDLEPLLRLDTAVVRIERRADGQPGWTFYLKTGKGVSSSLNFDYAIVASGMYAHPRRCSARLRASPLLRSSRASLASPPTAPCSVRRYSTPPNMPDLPGAKAFEAAGGKIVHSSQFTQSAIAAGKHVIVIGAAKSAQDVTIEVAKVAGAARATMVFREAHWGTPRHILGFIPFQYIFLSRFGQFLISVYAGPYPYGAPGWLLYAHYALSGLVGLVLKVVELIVAFQLGHYGEHRPENQIVVDFYGARPTVRPRAQPRARARHCRFLQQRLPPCAECDVRALPTAHPRPHPSAPALSLRPLARSLASSLPRARAGYGHLPKPEFYALRSQQAFDNVRGHVSQLEAGKAVITTRPLTGCLASGAAAPAELSVQCDLIVCATGYKKTYQYLPAAERGALKIEADGLYLYRNMFAPDVPGLAFCGAEIATISNIMTHAIQAEYIARVVAGSLALPDAAAQWAEIEAVKAWKRSWMPQTSSRAALVLLHQTHYHDALLSDMGQGWARKCDPLSTALLPYQPRDYDGVIGHASGRAADAHVLKEVRVQPLL